MNTLSSSIRPEFVDGRPLAGDEWARLHPEEAAAEELEVKEKLHRAIRAIKIGKPASFSDLFAGAFTTRLRLNVQDETWRRENKLQGTGVLHGLLRRQS